MASLLHTFETSRHSYLYDAGTNRIVRANPVTCGIAPLLDCRSRSEILDTLRTFHDPATLEREYAKLIHLRDEYGLLATPRLKRRAQPVTAAQVSAASSGPVDMLTLEVTQNCNYRCAYCTFGGGYAGHRTHGPARMDWQTARRAVDLYVARNRNSSEEYLSVSFYGGEPLLRYPFLQRIIAYARSLPIAPGKRFAFNMTTNASLLTPEMVRYFAANDVGLLVSLDGAQEDHDRWRLFADGTPSHEAVLQNVRMIRETAPAYYAQRVGFSATLTPAHDLLATERYFEGELFACSNVRVSSVSPGNGSFDRACPVHPERASQYAELWRRYVQNHVEARESSKLQVALFQSPLLRIHKRPIYAGMQERADTVPSCFPGNRKLFVTVDGRLHTCEKINQTLPFGHVTTGIDVEALTGIVNLYYGLMNGEDCLTCWAFRFCNVCYATFDDEGTLTQASKERGCGALRATMAENLAAYCYAVEENPHAWDYMDQIAIK